MSRKISDRIGSPLLAAEEPSRPLISAYSAASQGLECRKPPLPKARVCPPPVPSFAKRINVPMANPLTPPALAWGQVSLHHIRIQFDAEAGLFGYFDESILDVRPVEQQHLIHPATLARDGL